MNEYDEYAAIAAIKSALGEELSGKYTDDQLLNVIDMIWDFYEENGLLDIDSDEDMDESDVYDDLITYIKRMLKKDKESGILPEHIEPIVKAEIEYENTLDTLD
ncbi:MAG: hypothetical protein K2I18_07455 [Paramuribaculum sp.]|nr:hypothetical protein [Paramuribaculum sp.]